MEQNSIFLIVSTTFLAAFGAIAKLLSDIEHSKVTKKRIVASVASALFGGAMIGMLAMGFKPAAEWIPVIGAFGGLAGWAGKAFVDKLATTVTDKAIEKIAQKTAESVVNKPA
jgi:hypothetical protein